LLPSVFFIIIKNDSWNTMQKAIDYKELEGVIDVAAPLTR